MADEAGFQSHRLPDPRRWLDLTHDAIVVRDPEDRIVYWNRGAERLYGWSREEATGRIIHDLLQTEFSRSLDHIMAALRRDERWCGELTHRTRFGKRITVFARWVADRDTRGDVRAILETNTDISERQKAEKTLRESEQRLRAILDRAPAAIFVKDSEGRALYMNEECARILRVDGEETTGKTEDELFPPELARQFRSHDAEIWATGRSRQVEEFVERPDGRHTFISHKFLLRDTEGRPYALGGIAADITERHTMERALHESEARLKLALSVGGMGTWDWDVRTGQVHWTDEMFSILGYEPGTVEPSYAAWRDAVHAADLGRVEMTLRQAMRQGDDFRCEYRVVRSDGTVRWIDSRVRGEYEAGSLVRMIGVLRDVSDRKWAEEALRENEEYFRQLANSLPHLIWTCRPDGRCDFLNKRWEAYTGVPASEHLELGWLDAVHPDDRPSVLAAWEASVADGSDFQAELRIRRHDGGYRWFEARGLRLQDDEGRTVKWIGSNTDVTERKRAEEASAHLAAIVTSSNDAVVSKTLEGIVTSWNASAQRMFGYSDDEMIGQSILRLIPVDRREEEARILSRVRSGESVHNYETVRVAKDGRSLDVSLTISPIRDRRGRMIGASKIIRDISDRKRAEHALSQSERRFRLVVENLSEGLMIVDAQGSPIYQNRASLRIHGFGKPEDGVVGREDLPASWQAWDITGRLLAYEEWPVSRVLRGERFEGQILRARHVETGQQFYGRYNGCPIYSPDGKLALAFITIRDITSEVEARDALQASEERFRTLADNISQLAWMADASGWIFWYNRRWFEYTGTTLEQMQGWGWEQVHHPDHLSSVVRRWRQALEKGEPWEDTFPLRGRDGRFRWFLSRAVPIRDAHGRILRWFGTNTDVTEQRAVHEELRRMKDELEVRVQERTRQLIGSQQRLRALASELSLTEQRAQRKLAKDLHDYLAQLLVVGRLKTGQLKKEPGLSPRAQALGAEVDEALDQALAYTRTMIAELSPPSFQESGLTAALQWLAERMRKDGLFVDVQAGGESAALSEEQAVLLFQSVRELLINVLKHAGVDRATVRLTETNENDVHIAVEDRGTGLGPDALQRAAEPGHLGLFAVRERMEAMGGRLDLASVPGLGTTATLVLPLGSRCEKGGTRETSETSQSHHGSASTVPVSPVAPVSPFSQASRVRVLLVDDHVLFRKSIRTLLETHGDLHVVAEAADGAEALTLTEQHRPHVVLMDFDVPKMNGVEATRHIKQRHPHTVVIGLSANNHEQVRLDMRAVGAVDLLSKDVAPDDLYRLIKEAAPKGAIVRE